MSQHLKWLQLSSIACLIVGSFGAALSMATYQPARFGGLLHGTNVLLDFLLLSGTALSPPLVLLLAQLAFIVGAPRRDRLGTLSLAGLVVLGAGYVIGQLGEPTTLRSLTPATFNALHASIAVAIIVLSALMCAFSNQQLRQRNLQRKEVQL